MYAINDTERTNDETIFEEKKNNLSENLLIEAKGFETRLLDGNRSENCSHGQIELN